MSPACHEKGHQLIRARLNRDTAERPEGTGAASKLEAERVVEQLGRRIKRSEFRRIGERELSEFHRFPFELRHQLCDFIIGASDRAELQPVVFRTRLNNPGAAAGLDEIAGKERITHIFLP